MSIFNFLTLLGSLSLFLFGMSVMGTALEKRAGGSLKAILAKLTNGKFSGLLTGLAVTAVIQSSSATTVMVVGFVNSGLLSLKQSIPVIMGANIGTTVTAWLLSQRRVTLRFTGRSCQRQTVFCVMCHVLVWVSFDESRKLRRKIQRSLQNFHSFSFAFWKLPHST